VACAPILVRLFRRYGFREYASPIHDSIVGTLHRMLLVLDDPEHLTRIDSPFLGIAERCAIAHADRPWLSAIFETYKARHEQR
jgi:hypothetical protein